MIQVKIAPRRNSDVAARRKLEELSRKIKDPREANRRVSVWLLRWVNQNFRSQGGKVGGWAPFKHGGRRVRGGGVDTRAKLLQNTGRLRGSFQPFYSRVNAGVGSNVPYAEFHELGVPANNLPSRRMLPNESDQEVTDNIIKIYDIYLRRAARKKT